MGVGGLVSGLEKSCPPHLGGQEFSRPDTSGDRRFDMRVVFMGSADIACPTLEALMTADDIEVVAVVSQPDRPKGRNRKVQSCAVRAMMEERCIPIITPYNVNDEESVRAIKGFEPDLIVVIAYGQILKTEILNAPRIACVNVHTSLLPKYRGAAPIQWAIINGEVVTGVTTMFMNEGMDAGDVILQKEVAIDREDTAASLSAKLAIVGADLLLKTLRLFPKEEVVRIPQNDAEITLAPKLKKEDGRIDWDCTAEDIYNRIRGLNPWPCCRCVMPGGIGVRVLKALVEKVVGAPGEVIDVSGDGPLIGTADGSLRLLEIQPDGKKVMSGSAYMRGRALTEGDVLRKAEG